MEYVNIQTLFNFKINDAFRCGFKPRTIYYIWLLYAELQKSHCYMVAVFKEGYYWYFGHFCHKALTHVCECLQFFIDMHKDFHNALSLYDILSKKKLQWPINNDNEMARFNSTEKIHIKLEKCVVCLPWSGLCNILSTCLYWWMTLIFLRIMRKFVISLYLY